MVQNNSLSQARILFNNRFLERTMSDVLEEHDGKVSIGERTITNLQFSNDIDAVAEEVQELKAVV